MITEELDRDSEQPYFSLSPALDRPDETEEVEEARDVDRTDLLKMYLREASKPSMLTAAGEAAAAKRIESARARLAKLFSRSPIVAAYCLHLKEEFEAGQETPADFIETVSADNAY